MTRVTRRTRRDRGKLLRRIHHACQDCTGWADLVRYAPTLIVIEIAHDDSCPTLAALRGITR